MTAGPEYKSCGAPVEPTWWSQRCTGCQHGLMVHVTVGDVSVCDMCDLAADAKRWAASVVNDMHTQVVNYVEGGRTDDRATAKAYVDQQDGLVVQKVDKNQADAKTYIDQQDKNYQTSAKNYVDTQIPAVIKQKVIATALLP